MTSRKYTSQAAQPQKRGVTRGRVQKKKTTKKTKKTKKTKNSKKTKKTKKPSSTGSSNDSSKLTTKPAAKRSQSRRSPSKTAQAVSDAEKAPSKEALSHGTALFQKRFDPPWKQYSGFCLMGLPGEIRNVIFEYVLPIDFKIANGKEPTNVIRIGKLTGRKWFRRLLRDPSARQASQVHPVLRTCRQLRYEYGPLVMTTNSFEWHIPHDWNSRELTCFTQHSASIGVPDYSLALYVYDAIKGAETLEEEMERRENLTQWAKDVFDGVETRVLLAHGEKMKVAEHIITRSLHEAKWHQQLGHPWEKLEKALDSIWEDYEWDF